MIVLAGKILFTILMSAKKLQKEVGIKCHNKLWLQK